MSEVVNVKITQTDETGNVTVTEKPYSTNSLDSIGGRKFILVILIFILTWVSLSLKWVDAEVFKYVMYMLVITYVGGNVTQKLGTSIADIFKKQ